MVAEASEIDPLQFINFARTTMGAIDGNGLANQFSNAAGGSSPNFWQIGCAFDTILDYFLTLKEARVLSDPDRALLADLLPLAVHGYQYGIAAMSAAWYDDWCWWGIAASKAFDPDYEALFGTDYGDRFRSAALDLWGLVEDGDFERMAGSIPDEAWAKAAEMYFGQSFPQTTVQFSKVLLSERSTFHKGTRKAWELIERGATPAGSDRQKADHSHFTTQSGAAWAVPRFRGGCWQYDLSTAPFPWQDGPDWANPNPHDQTLGVFQVTLMSGLYLSFVCSLMAAARRKTAENKSGGAWDRLETFDAYREKADDVVRFLADWLEAPVPDSLAQYWPVGVLVHERTPTYARLSDGSYPPVQGYLENAFWGGDQGLIMGALKQYAGLAAADARGGAVPPRVGTLPMELLKGVFYNMPATNLPPGENLPGAVGPYRDPSHGPISGDSNDYGSGSGIFWRYVMRCCRLDPAFAPEARTSPQVVSMAVKSGTNTNGWGNDLFSPFNTVAAAIGAWHLMTSPVRE